MTEEARISGLYTEDPILIPQMAASRSKVILMRARGSRHEVYFHENPAHSNVPEGRELRRLLDTIEVEEYEPPVQGESHAEGEGVHEDEEKEGDAEEARGPAKKGPFKKAGKK